MDELDFAIVRAVMAAPFQGSARVAREVDASPQTVRNRLAALRQQTQGFRAIPAAEAFGLHGYAVLVPDGSLDDIAAIPGAYWAVVYDDGAAAGLVYADAPPRGVQAFEQRLQRRAVRQRPLTRSEWRILPALMQDALAPATKIAEKTGLAAKTVSKYRDRLHEDGLIHVVLHINEADVDAALWHHVFVLGRYPRRIHGIPLAWTQPPGAVMVLHASSARERVEQTRQIAQENPEADVDSRIGMQTRFLADRIGALVSAAAP